MEYKVLYRKYRPQIFDDVSGQDYSMKILKNAIESDKIAHAYLFTGPRGTGKTSTAKIFAKAINCTDLKDGNPCGKCACCTNENNPDIIEIDAASNNGVDEIRELINNVKIAPSYSKYKVYIIDEVHMLSTSAFNALLLTLEEPPGNVVFILATTDVQNVPVTILSRCQRFDFRPISEDKIYDRLKLVCKNESIKATDEALKEIAYVSNGGLRDALSILDQLSASKSKVDIEDVYQNFGTVSSVKIEQLIDAFVGNDISTVCSVINEFKENGINYVVLVEKIINKLKELALNAKVGNSKINFDNIYDLIVSLNDCLNSANINLNPYILIELTMVKYMDSKNEKSSKKEEKNISREIKLEENNDENNQKIISQEIIEYENPVLDDNLEELNEETDLEENENIDFSISDSLIDIRVNNCFVNASKQYKNEIGDSWQDFIEFVYSKNKNLYSVILDSSIAMASDKYIVLVEMADSNCNLINKKLELIQELYKDFTKKDYKFICLNDDKWTNAMELFKKNKKDGIIYKYIEETDNIESTEDTSQDDFKEISDIAEELFDSDVIEYE